MMRALLYGILGFFIFGIIGVIVGMAIYPEAANVGNATKVAGVFALVGTVLSVYFALWMDSHGEQKLEQFSEKPKMIWGIAGCVVGGFASVQIAQSFLDPTNSHSVFDMVLIVFSTIFCGWFGLHIARRFDLPNIGRVTTESSPDIIQTTSSNNNIPDA